MLRRRPEEASMEMIFIGGGVVSISGLERVRKWQDMIQQQNQNQTSQKMNLAFCWTKQNYRYVYFAMTMSLRNVIIAGSNSSRTIDVCSFQLKPFSYARYYKA